MPLDVITGNWSESTATSGTWATSDQSVFGTWSIKPTGKGTLYIDKNKNGIRDKGDKAIGSIQVTALASDTTNTGSGVWSLDPTTKTGAFYDPTGELVLANCTLRNNFSI